MSAPNLFQELKTCFKNSKPGAYTKHIMVNVDNKSDVDKQCLIKPNKYTSPASDG